MPLAKLFWPVAVALAPFAKAISPSPSLGRHSQWWAPVADRVAVLQNHRGGLSSGRVRALP